MARVPRARWMRPLLGIGLVLGIVASVGCQPAEEAPVATAKAFSSAVRRGDVKTVLALADAQSVETIEALARGASDQVGGRRKIEAHEMLQVVDIDRDFELSSATLLDNDGENATVALESTIGEREILTLIHQGDRWRVKMPTPADAAPADGKLEPAGG